MKKDGMNLITLIISVIVLIIITGVTIMGLKNTGIIEKTEMAVEDMNLKNLEQLANIAYANIYLDNLSQGVRREITGEEVRTRMQKDGTEQEVLDKYDIIVQDGDIFISIKEEE